MKVRVIDSSENNKIFTLDENFEVKNIDPVKKRIFSNIQRGFDIILNFENVNEITSKGLGFLVSILKMVKKNNRKLKVVNLQPFVREVIKTTQLNRVLDIYEDLTKLKQGVNYGEW